MPPGLSTRHIKIWCLERSSVSHIPIFNHLTSSIPLQHSLQSHRAQIRIIRNLLNDGHKSCEFITSTVGEQGRNTGRLHFCVLEVQLDESDVHVSLGEGTDAVFDISADV